MARKKQIAGPAAKGVASVVSRHHGEKRALIR